MMRVVERVEEMVVKSSVEPVVKEFNWTCVHQSDDNRPFTVPPRKI